MKKLAGKTPEIRFSGFNELWQHTELNNLLKESKKKNRDLEYSKDEVLSVSGEFGVVNQIEHLGRSYAGESVHNYGIVEVGEIVYTKSPLKANPYGIIKLNRGKAGIVSTLYAIYKTIPSKADGVFLDQYFSSDTNTNRYLRPLVKKGAKNDMKINNDYVLHDRIFVPSLPEQQRIAAFLTEIDNKLQALKRKKALLEQYKKGMMQKLFSQELRFRDENGKTYPIWEKKKLGDIAVFSKGKGISKNDISEDGVVECIRYGQLYTVYSETISNAISRTNITAKDLVLSKANDVIIPASGETQIDIATASCVLKEGIALGGDLNIIRSDFNGVFLSYYLNSAKKIDIARLSQGISVVHLYSSQLTQLNVEYPSLPEQTKIANFLTAIDQKIAQVGQQISKAETWKKGLLQKMFV